jgi:hypothetical protein
MIPYQTFLLQLFLNQPQQRALILIHKPKGLLSFLFLHLLIDNLQLLRIILSIHDNTAIGRLDHIFKKVVFPLFWGYYLVALVGVAVYVHFS